LAGVTDATKITSRSDSSICGVGLVVSATNDRAADTGLSEGRELIHCAPRKQKARLEFIDMEGVVDWDGIEPPTPAFRRTAGQFTALRAKPDRGWNSLIWK